MKVAKLCIGILLAIAAVAGGLYVGLWLCLVGGIVQVIEGAKATPVASMDIGIGVLRFMLAGVSGALTFMFTAAVAAAFLKN